MVHLIDKDTLVERIKKLKMDIGNIVNEYDEGFWEGRNTAFDDINCAINTLEVKEVDLDAELEHYKAEQNIKYEEDINMFEFAKHFFELGLQSTQKEEPKKCMYSKDSYTDEDRKVLCDGCEEDDDFTKALAECIHQAQGSVFDPMAHAEIWKDELIKLAKSEEPVSENLEEAAKHYLYSNILYDDVYVGNPTDKDCIEMFKAGAKWQKDLELTVDDIKDIDRLLNQCIDYSNPYQEVLKRFKEKKEK